MQIAIKTSSSDTTRHPHSSDVMIVARW